MMKTGPEESDITQHCFTCFTTGKTNPVHLTFQDSLPPLYVLLLHMVWPSSSSAPLLSVVLSFSRVQTND